MKKTVHSMIAGRVQGVSYRAWTIENAAKLQLDGWVRNRSDGRVEAVFSGNAAKVDQMLDLCWKGPSAAQVTNIETHDHPEVPEKGFRHLPTI